jgi:hypothetical protein|tara:strand:+ start:2988 stop:3245 length:258 start_codon:yes stop_codon:yes gene_type:complete
MKILILLMMYFLTFFQFVKAGVSDAQRRVIDNQLFLLKEGMINEKEVFKKAKKFDEKGIFGIGSDEMTREEYKEYLRKKNFTIHD